MPPPPHGTPSALTAFPSPSPHAACCRKLAAPRGARRALSPLALRLELAGPLNLHLGRAGSTLATVRAALSPPVRASQVSAGSCEFESPHRVPVSMP